MMCPTFPPPHTHPHPPRTHLLQKQTLKTKPEATVIVYEMHLATSLVYLDVVLFKPLP